MPINIKQLYKDDYATIRDTHNYSGWHGISEMMDISIHVAERPSWRRKVWVNAAKSYASRALRDPLEDRSRFSLKWQLKQKYNLISVDDIPF